LRFVPTPIAGAYLVEVERHVDERGFFARVWCRQEFARAGIDFEVVQASLSHNPRAGTLRGMHYQCPPSREAKVIRCSRGSIYDVIIDLRADSRTHLHHYAVELSSESASALLIPHGCAHGFQTLFANTDVLYMMSDEYNPGLASGVRYDDPQFRISWPLAVTCIADRDARYPDYTSR
jgi:dTDP-4-dehydrorhamnose 3,5-epimerase